MRKTSRKTTLKDVANLCGVSPMTVSKMLNGKGGVSKETAERIWDAVQKLNYTPNLVAKSLRVNKTLTFGIVTSDSSALLFAKMIKGVIDEAANYGYSVIIANSALEQAREREAVRTLLDKRVDGLLIAAPFYGINDVIEEVRRFGVPIVLLLRSYHLPVDSVTSDNFQGAYDITKYLAEKGERDIYYLGLPTTNPNGEERRYGYERALRDHGIRYDGKKVFTLEPTIEDCHSVTKDLLRSNAIRKGSFFCGCDMQAIGAVEAVLNAGLSVPRDVRVCGFDDIDMLDHLKVPLTTMRQDIYTMGREGIRLLINRIENPESKPCQIKLPCELVVRDSA